MRLLLILSTVLITCVLLDACSKTNKVLEPGISYGITGIVPQTAANGDTISIYGAGFSTDTAGNTVSIHGVSAKVVTASARMLQVIVPSAPRQGNIEVKTGSQSSTNSDPFTLATVVTGNQSQNTTWVSSNLYLLKGFVHFSKGATLTIQGGTTILGDKSSAAGLIIDDGAAINSMGTADSPVVFASSEVINLRLPGDWSGITLAATSTAAADRITYTRIEYAGYHNASQPGAALLIDRPVPAGNLQYVEAAYSGSDGFRSNAADGSVQYLKYLVAYGCAGNDFAFEGSSRVFGQFLLGLKDPIYADALGADGLLVQSSQPVTISNLSLVGYSDLARNITGQNGYRTNGLNNTAVNPNSGRGVHIGGMNYNGDVTIGTLQLFNSLVAAPFLAGISLDGPVTWSHYEDGSGIGSVIRQTTITYIPDTNTDNPQFNNNNISGPRLPLMGTVLSAENSVTPLSGFQTTDGSAQLALFSGYNDSARLLNSQAPNSSLAYNDDLGIRNMVLYSRLNSPILIPQNGSSLFTGASFTDGRLADPFFDPSGTFRGGFGSNDWTKGWANYNPQLTSYQ